MATKAEKDAREKRRVKNRQLDGIDRLITFLPQAGPHEENWALIEMDKITGIPPSVCGDRPLIDEERLQVFTMAYKHAPEIWWYASVFARVETGSNHFQLESN